MVTFEPLKSVGNGRGMEPIRVGPMIIGEVIMVMVEPLVVNADGGISAEAVVLITIKAAVVAAKV